MAIDLDVHGNTQPLEAAVQAAVNRIRRTPIKITVDDRGATQPLGNMKRGADEFTKSMEAANARILAFGASMAIINGVADSFKAMVRNMVEVEKAMADINVVMGLSSQSLEKFGDGLFKVAKETGAAFNIAAQAATEYARQGLAVEESLKRTRDALILTRLTGMDSAEAVKSLTAAMNTYGNQIKDTTQLVSKFAAVDVQFAVSAEDFAQAISRTGAAAKGAGVDIDELIGIVTAAQQQTARGGAVIGNSLKTIFTRIGRADTLNQLENLGLAVRDVEGNTMGAKRILTDLANTFDKLGEAQKSQIAQTVGGVFQINILKAILGDAAKQNGILARATQISSSATDEAIDKNEQLRNTMAAMATETGLSLKQLSAEIGELMLAPGVEKILNTVKSLSEGISGALGDGESIGGKFGKGFLTGIGNIITGPGLVVVFAVLGKLAAQAFKFTKESLTSLVGVTSESQKQKAIQTSLVSLFGQNAALNKEILRTDISRTEKEKIILGLLQAQTVEANKLNATSKQLASTLYSRGYGPNLTKGKSRAYGHIPNFAHPEREQAAKGGYAAGTIRSINMPGEGSVIYNSAEKVKNFKGMSQPAIMPPQSSKAGKNYQQAFGNIHGFDPYAAGGYVPNFAGPRTHVNQGSSKYIGLSATNSADRAGTLYATAGKGMSNVFSNVGKPYREAATKSKGAKIDYEFYSLDESERRKYYNTNVEDELKESLQRAGHGIMNQLLKTLSSKDQNFIAKKADLSKDLPENKMSVAAGHIFEAAAKTILRSIGGEAAIPDSETARIDFLKNEELYKLFGVKGPKGSVGAEAKINSDTNNAKSFARKIYDLEIGAKGITNTSKTSELLKTSADRKKFDIWVVENAGKTFDGITISETPGRRANMLKNREKKSVLAKAFSNRNNAYGHIPNFADPLSDAIGREKAAGVPVSQIRVGSHGALMGKGNPLGLGVTNTYDEPNGLRDVFGANGFVPNYATPSVSAGDIIPDPKFQRLQKTQQQLADQYNKVLKRLIDRYEKGIGTHGQLDNNIQRLNSKYNIAAKTQDRVTSEVNKNIGVIGKLNQARRRYTNSISSANKSFGGTAAGKAFASSGGQMALMMGLPMAGGFLQDAIGGTAGAGIGGAMTGAAAGASIGMMFGPLGTAIGTTVGAFGGLISAIDDVNKAEKERAQAVGKSIASSLPAEFFAAARKGMTGAEVSQMKPALPSEHVEKDWLVAAERFVRGGSDEKQTSYMRKGFIETSQKQGEIIGKYLSGVESKRLYDVIESVDKESGEITFAKTKKAMTGPDYAAMLESAGILDPKTEGQQIALEEIRAQLINAIEKEVVTQEEQANAIILQLNIQKAIIDSQKAAAQVQFDIKSKYIKQGNIIDTQLKYMSGFISEEQKARLKYVQSMNKASEAYESGQAGIKQGKREKLLGLVAQSPDLRQKIKTQLYKDQLSEGERSTFEAKTEKEQAEEAEKSITNIVELNKRLLALQLDVLEAKIESSIVNEQEKGDLDLIVSQTQLKLINLENEKKLKESSLKNDRLINVELGKRADIMKELVAEAEAFHNLAQFEERMNQYEERVRRAEYKIPVNERGIYRSEQQNIAFEKKQLQTRIELSESTGLERSRSAVAKKFEELKLDPKDLKRQDFTPQGLRARAIKMAEEQKTILEKAPKAENDKEKEARQQTIQGYQQIIDGKGQVLDSIQKVIESEQQANDELDVKNQALRKELELREKNDKYKRGESLPGDNRSALNRGFSESIKSMRDQAQYMDYQLGEKIPFAFADGMANAMTEAINGTKDLKDALSDAAMGFLGMIQQAMMQSLAYRLVGGMGFAMPGMMSRGGNVRSYSRGGGVPARVSDGEYVMGRDAVNKYGGSFMHGLNAGGRIPGFSDGGSVERDLIDQGVIKRESDYSGTGAKGSALAANFGGGRGFKSGRQYQRRAMSSFFYKQSGNVGLEEDVGAMGSILQEEESRRQEAERKRQEKKAKRRQLIGMVASIGLMYGLSSSGLFGPKAPAGTGAVIPGQEHLVPVAPHRLGGPIRKYASGGYISGKSGIDQIPAMLSEGEYVIRASSARQIGKPMLDRINAGKFNEGGPVTEMEGSQESSNTGSGNTNNINISINLEKGSAKESASQDQNQEGDRSNEQMKEFSDKIKKQVLSVIVEEQRPGGLLQDTK